MTASTDIHVLLRAFADELARCGVSGVCTSPGSRSTPLVMALTREPGLTCTSHVDERSAGFFALGLAKATGRPAVVVCTSGTAAANYLPAVVEAREARVPLIVLTADRPPELRDSGAGQAVDQLGLYGTQAKWFAEVGVDAATPETCRWMRALACRAVWTAHEGRPGAVHLNWPLREPLVPTGPLPEHEPGGGGRPDGRPWVSRILTPTDATDAAGTLAPIIRAAQRGVIVVGRDERGARGDRTLGQAAAALAEACGWPLLADPLSGARTGPHAVAHYDALLRLPAFAVAARPDAVLRVGDLPPSKPLRQWLTGLDAIQVLVDPEGAWQDPAQVVDLSVAADAVSTLTTLAAQDLAPTDPADDAWTAAWRDADERAAQAIARTLGDDLSEPRVAQELGTALPADATLFVAASMPIRDAETFFPVRDAATGPSGPPRVLSNRGANGIDGTIATAYGVAAVSDGPVVLYLGDVAFAHDLGSLLIAKRIGVPLTIVLVDNGGGGIFDFLPVSTQDDLYEQHVATPTGLDAGAAAALFGLHHLEVATVEELRAALDHGLTSAGTTLLHVRTERAANVELHRRVWDAVAGALAAERSR